jgi:REP element-mobilizing transposase RayT
MKPVNMKYNPQIHHRKSIRLKGYDYAQPGLYFITVCCKDRVCLFGLVTESNMVLNNGGQIANQCWLDIPAHFPNDILHEYVVMPNHVHGIIELLNVDDEMNIGANVGAKNLSPLQQQQQTPQRFQSPSKTIGSVIRGFKTGVTKWFRSNTEIDTIWQRNYYEHIIRNEQSYQTISHYIINNPSKWNDDKFFKS